MSVTTANAEITGEPSEEHGGHPKQKISLALALVALGIVFGDIGTSPLYAFNEVFAHNMTPSRANVQSTARRSVRS